MIETETQQLPTTSAPDFDTPAYATCDECSSPMDEAQRYCVVCGAYRPTSGDPVARYLSATRRPRAAAPAAPVAVATSGTDRRWTVLALVLLPIAAAGGVLVGRGGSHSDADILAALKAQKAPVVQVGGAGAAGVSAAGAGGGSASDASTITSDFSLSKGFVVRLSTLPASSDSAAVSKAKQSAKGKGAKAVGVINPADFALKPASGGKLVIYSGQFKTRAQAAKALSKLKGKFPGAAIVAVSPSSSGSGASSSTAAVNSDGGTTAAQAKKDTAPPTAAQKAQGEKVVQQIQAKKGKSYVQQQQKLPDTIVVP
jgi:hypothetical protein